MASFEATIEPVPGGGHFVVIPKAAAEAAGLRHGVRVRGKLGGTAYRSSLMTYSGAFHLGVHKATLAEAGVAAGDVVELTIELDDEPLPTDAVPADLAQALADNAAAAAAFAAQAPSHKREHVKYVLAAKQAETRARRIAKTVETLVAAPVKSKPARTKSKPTRVNVRGKRAARR